MKLAKFTTNSKDIYVNPQHVACVSEGITATTRISFITDSLHVEVIESVADVAKALEEASK